MKRITIQLSIASLLLTLSACGANMKPDHQQVYDSYRDRRVPKENSMASAGDYQKQKEELAKIQGYKGGLYNQIDPKKANENGTLSKSDEPFMDRLMKKFGVEPSREASAADATSSNLGVTTRIPSQQPAGRAMSAPAPQMRDDVIYAPQPQVEDYKPMSYLERPNTPMGEGSANNYTYYDLADDIIPASPVHEVHISKLDNLTIQLASNDSASSKPMNPSAPLVDVPATPSVEELKAESQKSLVSPQLRDIPKSVKSNMEPVDESSDKNTQEQSRGVTGTPPHQGPHKKLDKKKKKPQSNPEQNPKMIYSNSAEEYTDKNTQEQSKGGPTSPRSAPKHQGPHKKFDNDKTNKPANNPEDPNMMSSDVIKDPSAKLYYQNGRTVVSGVMSDAENLIDKQIHNAE